MRICIVGPGALGCLHAALLARAGRSVSLLDHRPDRAEHIRCSGITVEDAGSMWSAPVLCSASPYGVPVPKLLVLCVKTTQTHAALAHAEAIIGPGTVILRLQNGLADTTGLAEAAAPERVLLGTSGHGANTVGWGHVRHAGSGPTRLGPLCPEGIAAAERAAAALAPLGDIEVVEDVRLALWQKLVVNAAINPLTALTGLRNGQLLEVPLLQAAVRDLAREAEGAALAAGLPLESGTAVGAAFAACRQTAANRSSMLQDAHAGRETEVRDISGAVAREAEAARAAAPLNRAMEWLVSEVLGPGETKARALKSEPAPDEPHVG